MSQGSLIPLPGSLQCCQQDVLPLCQLVALFCHPKLNKASVFTRKRREQFCGMMKGINGPLKRKAARFFIRRPLICGIAKVNAFYTLQWGERTIFIIFLHQMSLHHPSTCIPPPPSCCPICHEIKRLMLVACSWTGARHLVATSGDLGQPGADMKPPLWDPLPSTSSLLTKPVTACRNRHTVVSYFFPSSW